MTEPYFPGTDESVNGPRRKKNGGGMQLPQPFQVATPRPQAHVQAQQKRASPQLRVENNAADWYVSETMTTHGGFEQDASESFGPPQPAFNRGYSASPFQQQTQGTPYSGGYDSSTAASSYASFYNTPGGQPQKPPTFFMPSPMGIMQTEYSGQMQMQGQMFGAGGSGGYGDDYDYSNEPPLLEELGINFEHIRLKTVAVLNPLTRPAQDVILDADLAGPLVFCLLFGFSLLLHGKVYFGNIYGTGMLGCLGMYALLNLMAESERSISLTNTASVLGYCLMPMALLSLLAAVLSLQGFIGYIVTLAAIFWSGHSSAKLFAQALQMHGQLILVAYPCTLLYMAFALLAIF